jgi:hypothetical protein
MATSEWSDDFKTLSEVDNTKWSDDFKTLSEVDNTKWSDDFKTLSEVENTKWSDDFKTLSEVEPIEWSNDFKTLSDINQDLRVPDQVIEPEARKKGGGEEELELDMLELMPLEVQTPSFSQDNLYDLFRESEDNPFSNNPDFMRGGADERNTGVVLAKPKSTQVFNTYAPVPVATVPHSQHKLVSALPLFDAIDGYGLTVPGFSGESGLSNSLVIKQDLFTPKESCFSINCLPSTREEYENKVLRNVFKVNRAVPDWTHSLDEIKAKVVEEDHLSADSGRTSKSGGISDKSGTILHELQHEVVIRFPVERNKSGEKVAQTKSMTLRLQNYKKEKEESYSSFMKDTFDKMRQCLDFPHIRRDYLIASTKESEFFTIVSEDAEPFGYFCGTTRERLDGGYFEEKNILNTMTKDQKKSILFQIWATKQYLTQKKLACDPNRFRMMKTLSTKGKHKASDVDVRGFWKYKINGVEYFVENLGYLVVYEFCYDELPTAAVPEDINTTITTFTNKLKISKTVSPSEFTTKFLHPIIGENCDSAKIAIVRDVQVGDYVVIAKNPGTFEPIDTVKSIDDTSGTITLAESKEAFTQAKLQYFPLKEIEQGDKSIEKDLPSDLVDTIKQHKRNIINPTSPFICDS